jgi:hypothetical protein
MLFLCISFPLSSLFPIHISIFDFEVFYFHYIFFPSFALVDETFIVFCARTTIVAVVVVVGMTLYLPFLLVVLTTRRSYHICHALF